VGGAGKNIGKVKVQMVIEWFGGWDTNRGTKKDEQAKRFETEEWKSFKVEGPGDRLGGPAVQLLGGIGRRF